MDFDVFVYQDESGAFIARVPAIAGCHSWGNTKAEALEHVRDAIGLALADEEPLQLHRIGIETVSVGA